MTDSKRSPKTYQRIMEAAGDLFGRKGFHGTTVKEITDLAGANVAGVNYHFGDKRKLYEEVVLSMCMCIREKFPMDKDFDQVTSPEERLRLFVRNMLFRLLDPLRPSWQGALFAQEMSHPGPLVSSMMEEEMKKIQEMLYSILRDLLGPHATPEPIALCSASIVGQVRLLGPMAGPRIPSLPREGDLTPDRIEEIARHITEFSLAGIGRLRSGGEEREGGDPQPRGTGKLP